MQWSNDADLNGSRCVADRRRPRHRIDADVAVAEHIVHGQPVRRRSAAPVEDVEASGAAREDRRWRGFVRVGSGPRYAPSGGGVQRGRAGRSTLRF
jgi:hypothetical protein